MLEFINNIEDSNLFADNTLTGKLFLYKSNYLVVSVEDPLPWARWINNNDSDLEGIFVGLMSPATVATLLPTEPIVVNGVEHYHLIVTAYPLETGCDIHPRMAGILNHEIGHIINGDVYESDLLEEMAADVVAIKQGSSPDVLIEVLLKFNEALLLLGPLKSFFDMPIELVPNMPAIIDDMTRQLTERIGFLENIKAGLDPDLALYSMT